MKKAYAVKRLSDENGTEVKDEPYYFVLAASSRLAAKAAADHVVPHGESGAKLGVTVLRHGERIKSNYREKCFIVNMGRFVSGVFKP